MKTDLFKTKQARTVLFVLAWALCAWYLWTRIDRGWGPPDEGLLGESAERWLNGEMPHRDFDDFYTGGLTFLHGWAFELLGIRMSSMRLVLFAAVVLWLPFVQLIARRFVTPLTAAGLTILATVWSLPAYPAPMPSWYNVFLATAGLWAILRFLDTSAYRWAFVAGVCVGVSMLAKITGLYFLASLFLAVIARAYLLPMGEPTDESASERRVGAWAGLLAAATLVVAIISLLASRSSLGTWLLLFAPPALACLTLGVIVVRAGSARWSDLWRPIAVVALGAIIGVAPLVVYFASQGALGDLVHGVFVLPLQRVDFAGRAPDPTPFVWALTLMGVVAAATRIRAPRAATVFAIVLAICGIWIYSNGIRTEGPGGIGGGRVVYSQMVGSLAAAMPLVIGVFAWLVAKGRTGHLARPQLAATFAVVAVATLSALLAFPFSNDLYFHYVAPLLALAAVAVLGATGRTLEPRVSFVLVAIYLAFPLKHVAVRTTAPLAIDRGGLRVSKQDSSEVEWFVNLMREKARGEYIYATPDSPEAYFLTGLRNPTRTMYEFFDRKPQRAARTLAALDARRVNVVALSHWTIFSDGPDSALVDALNARYPHDTTVWHFTIRWRDPQ